MLRHTLTRTLVVALAVTALSSPAAQARPADPVSPDVGGAGFQQHRDAAAATKARLQELRNLRAGKGSYTPGATVVEAATPQPLPAPPTWPANPQAISPPADVAGGRDWTTILLGTAGSLLVLATIAGLTRRIRRQGHARIAA